MLSMLAQGSAQAPPVILARGKKRKEDLKFKVFILHQREVWGKNSYILGEHSKCILVTDFLPQYQNIKSNSMRKMLPCSMVFFFYSSKSSIVMTQLFINTC